jgi:hypothetical protein
MTAPPIAGEHSPLNRHFAFCPVRNITPTTNTYTSVSTKLSLYPGLLNGVDQGTKGGASFAPPRRHKRRHGAFGEGGPKGKISATS